MITTTLNPTDNSIIEALWTLIRPLKQSVRRQLATRLEDSIREENKTKSSTMDIEEAMKFVESLSVKGKEKVPNDARGIEALIEEKYSV